MMNVVGDVEGRNCLLVDDLIDTAGTLVKGAEALLKKGAASVSACATHAVLSGPAVSRIEASSLKEVVFTNSIPLSKEARKCEPDQVVVDREAAGGGHPVDSRGDFGERVVCLEFGLGPRRTHVSRDTGSNPAPAGRTGLRSRQGEIAVRREITVAAEVRTSRGKNEARRTRRAGQIPAVVYGAFKEPVSVAVNPREIMQDRPQRHGLQHHLQPGDRGRRNHAGHGGGPAGGSRFAGTLLHADFKRIDLTKRMRVSDPGAHHGRAEGREGAGRAARSDHPRDRNRVPAGRDSGELHGGCHRVDDRPEQARQRRGADRLHEAGELARDRDRARGGAARRGSGRAGRRSRRRHRRSRRQPPAEPEVIKKGKKEEEAPPRKRKKAEKRARRSSAPCSWWPVWGIRARSTRSRRITWGSSRSTGWPSGTASASPARIRRRSSGVGEIDGQPVMLAKPQTFMNLSGTSLAPLMEKHSIEPEQPGGGLRRAGSAVEALRIKPKGSAAGHNGMKSVIAQPGDQRDCAGAVGDSSGPSR